MTTGGLDAGIVALGYLLIGSDKLEDWQDFGTAIVGLQVADRTGGTLALRMDDRVQRIMVERGRETQYTIGWDVGSSQALDALAARVEAAGVKVRHGTADEIAKRCVADLVAFDDPLGNRVELFVGLSVAADRFVPGRVHSGFMTGKQGLGHVVLSAPDAAPLVAFYVDLLGFRLSDYQRQPFPAYFFHVNSRHHSLAIVQAPNSGLHHLMLEHRMLDDVGQGLDLAMVEQRPIAVSLGRHSNDFVTSYYLFTPSPFMIECGWGGREIDPANWEPVELKYGPSLWGHDRHWLPPDQFEVARTIRIEGADNGARAPIYVAAGYHVVRSDDHDAGAGAHLPPAGAPFGRDKAR